MKVDRNTKTEEFIDDDDLSTRLTVFYDNRGAPYREGVGLSLGYEARVFLDEREGRRLRDFLNRLFPE